jgi:hypothetical protein
MMAAPILNVLGLTISVIAALMMFYYPGAPLNFTENGRHITNRVLSAVRQHGG